MYISFDNASLYYAMRRYLTTYFLLFLITWQTVVWSRDRPFCAIASARADDVTYGHMREHVLTYARMWQLFRTNLLTRSFINSFTDTLDPSLTHLVTQAHLPGTFRAMNASFTNRMSAINKMPPWREYISESLKFYACFKLSILISRKGRNIS